MLKYDEEERCNITELLSSIEFETYLREVKAIENFIFTHN